MRAQVRCEWAGHVTSPESRCLWTLTRFSPVKTLLGSSKEPLFPVMSLLSSAASWYSAFVRIISISPGDRLRLTFTSRLEQNLAVLKLAGSLARGPTLQTVRAAVRQVLHTNPVDEILLDLAGVTAVDSHGLGELTVAYTVARQQRCSLRLARVSPRSGTCWRSPALMNSSYEGRSQASQRHAAVQGRVRVESGPPSAMESRA
jgi:anti-anti-sigma factor